jgi:hypothetical protein
MIRKIKLGLAGLAVAAASLFMAASASAATFSGTCAQYVTGSYTSVSITDTSSECFLAVDVISSGPITINSTNAILSQNIESTGGGNRSITTTAPNAQLNVQGKIAVTGATSSSGSIVINNTGNVNITGAITTTLQPVLLQVAGTGQNEIGGQTSTTNAPISLLFTGMGATLHTGEIKGTNSNITVKNTGTSGNGYIIISQVSDTAGFVYISSATGVFGAIKSGRPRWGTCGRNIVTN